MRSALYTGMVLHERMRPRRHKLAYRVFSLLFDLDELPSLRGRFGLLGIEGPGLLSFRESDHGDGKTPLKGWVARVLGEAGIAWDVGRVELLAYPRMFGFVFNPLSVYFCHDKEGALVAILYEVHNTHGERHTYVLPATSGDPVVRHSSPKQFFVSPFMPMDCTYRFRIRPPGERVGISILEDDSEGLLLTASFTGRRRELSNAALGQMLLAYPLMTLKVVAGIHWESLKLIGKRMPWHHWRPAERRIAVSAPPQDSPAPKTDEREAA
jgi:uncharacterized protein